MASIPAPIRATLGLLATALDTVQELVEHAPELPMEAVGNSMQLSLRLQQHYVALLNRGDEFLANLRGAPDDVPAWATFDEPPTGETAASSAGDGAPSSDDAAVADLPPAHRDGQAHQAGQGDPLLDAIVAAAAPTGRKAAKTATKTGATRGNAAAKKAPAGAKTVPAGAKTMPAAKPVPAAKVAARKNAGPGKEAAARKESVAAANPRPPKKSAKKATPKKVAPVRKSAPAKRVVPARMAQPQTSAPARRAVPRRPRKVAPSTRIADTAAITLAIPTLASNLANAAPNARQLSAFDRVDLALDAPETAPTAAESPTSTSVDSVPVTVDDPSSDAS